jgi:hypothetical protein
MTSISMKLLAATVVVVISAAVLSVIAVCVTGPMTYRILDRRLAVMVCVSAAVLAGSWNTCAIRPLAAALPHGMTPVETMPVMAPIVHLLSGIHRHVYK